MSRQHSASSGTWGLVQGERFVACRSAAKCDNCTDQAVRTFSAVILRRLNTGLLVGHLRGLQGAHSQWATVDELQSSLQEVIKMVLEDG